MTDVFFCSLPQPRGSLRHGMKEVCWRRWREEPGIDLRPLTPVTCSNREFQKIRRMLADSKSSGQLYVCADDDCLPGAKPFVGKVLEIMARHPDFGIISLWPSNCTINRWTPEDYQPFEDDEVMEHVSVGGIRFCRKGAMVFGDDIRKIWPPMEPGTAGYDAQHCQELRKAGYRVGYFKGIKMNHIGETYSTVWP